MLTHSQELERSRNFYTTLKTFRSRLEFKFHICLIEILLVRDGYRVQEHGGITLIKFIMGIFDWIFMSYSYSLLHIQSFTSCTCLAHSKIFDKCLLNEFFLWYLWEIRRADGTISITQIRTLELREADIYSESHTCKWTGPREGSVSLNVCPRGKPHGCQYGSIYVTMCTKYGLITNANVHFQFPVQL